MSGARLIGSLRYRDFRYPKNHPLRVPRVSLLLEFLQAEGLIRDEEKVESRFATLEELLLFHSREYVEALMEADRCMCVPRGARERFNIGTYENPVSPATFRGSSLATGSSVQAVDLFLDGYRPFNPAGGMHHAFRDRANGFCFINDPGVAIEVLKRRGFRRILYVDLDAHHCDGVQEAYYDTDEVYVVSFHQSPEYAFPFRTGYLHERGEGRGKGFNLNVPMPEGLNDNEFLYILERVLGYLRDVFMPEVYLLQLGTDLLKEDYLSRFEITNRGFLEAFRLVREAFGEGIYLGGGGYHPIALVRAWTLIWCEMSGRRAPERVGVAGRKVLESVDWEEFDDEVDRSYMYELLLDPRGGGPVRQEVKDLVLRVKTEVYS
ncbi:MAG: acetoin utilization protein AcuC [Aquificota bacterium]|nr:acetoin utilization protein AcuC [Aquificota bacterium]